MFWRVTLFPLSDKRTMWNLIYRAHQMELIPIACQIYCVTYMAFVKNTIDFWNNFQYLQVLQESRD
jgi:hypothetical protein